MSLVGKSEGNSPLGRPRHRLENNNKIDLKEKRMSGKDCIHPERMSMEYISSVTI
jgi:hypothetical protein